MTLDACWSFQEGPCMYLFFSAFENNICSITFVFDFSDTILLPLVNQIHVQENLICFLTASESENFALHFSSTAWV